MLWKRITSILTMIMLILTANGHVYGEEDIPFTDVDENAWHYDGVKYVYQYHLMNGVSNELFDPYGNVTRGMLVTILHRVEGEPNASTKAKFSDVADSSYYSNAVAWASDKGIVNGYNESTFGPNDNVTREQLATFLYRYASNKNLKTTKDDLMKVYTDFGEVSEFGLEPMMWAESNGIIKGVDEYHLDPKGISNRAQIATVIKRYNETVVNLGSGYVSEEENSGEIHNNEPENKEEDTDNSKDYNIENSTPDVSDNSEVNQEDNTDKDEESINYILEDGNLLISAETVETKQRGLNVAVPVNLRNNPGVLAMVLSLYYDDSVLTLVDAESGEALSPLTFTKPGRYESPCRFLWDGQELEAKDVKDGTVLTLYFDVAKDAAPGTYPIRLLAGNKDILDAELNPLTADLEAGGIVIK